MATVKETVNGKLAALLARLQNRLTRVSSETHQNTDAIAAIQDQVRVKVGGLEGHVVDVNNKVERAHRALIYNGERTDKLIADLGLEHGRLDSQNLIIQGVKKENDEREARQVIRDQSNVQSLTNLRDSVQKGFDQVRNDVESLLRTVQRLNERIGQVESQNGILLSRVNAIAQETLSAAKSAALPTDHIWVNKKLTGVYDSLTDLENRIHGPCAAFHHMVGIEKRVTELESEIELITAVRVANAAFVLGPRKSPTVMKPTTINEPSLAGTNCATSEFNPSANNGLVKTVR